MTTSHHARLQPSSAKAAALEGGYALSRHGHLSSAAMEAFVLPLWASNAVAQETQDTEAQTQGADQAQSVHQVQQTEQSGEISGPAAQDQGQTSGGQQTKDGGSDAMLETVGTTEIRNSDQMRAVGASPPPMNAQPPEIPANVALQQLFLREVIVQEARSQGLAEDPEVQSLIEGATRTAEEDALVQLWLQRELSNRVTPEMVDQAYPGLQAVTEGEVPSFDQIRPQIEQSLLQWAVKQIRASPLSGENITLYGPDGQPVSTPFDGTADPGRRRPVISRRRKKALRRTREAPQNSRLKRGTNTPLIKDGGFR